ncbi:TPA: hypothetical protein I7181_18155 [Vibrio vulnificus]|nr:hypothetical protein [Vibrio vulnificus]
MNVWYSPKKNAFFNKMVTPSFFDKENPVEPIADAVSITPERHKELLNELRTGRLLTSVETESGVVPVTVEQCVIEHVPTDDEIRELRLIQYKNRVDPISNEAYMERLSGNIPAAEELEARALLEYQKIKQELPLSSNPA